MNINFIYYHGINAYKLNYWVLIITCRLYYNPIRQNWFHEIVLANTDYPVDLDLKDIESQCLCTIELHEGDTSDLYPGMVFNKSGKFLHGKTKHRFKKNDTKLIYFQRDWSYYTNDLNTALSNTNFPIEIIKRNQKLNYHPKFHCGITSDGLTAILPNDLVLRQMYPYNLITSMNFLNRWNKKIITNKVSMKGLNFLIVNYANFAQTFYSSIEKYCFTQSQISGFDKLIKAFNSFYMQRLNAKKGIIKEPNDIIIDLPFDIDIKIKAYGEKVSENLFIVYRLDLILPKNEKQELFKVDKYYIINTEGIEFCDNYYYDNPLELQRDTFLKNAIIADSLNCRLQDYPTSVFVNPNSIDFLRFAQFINGNGVFKMSKLKVKYIINKDDGHFQKTLKAIFKLKFDRYFVTINNSRLAPYSTVKLVKLNNVQIILKLLIIKINHDGNEYILIDSGADFPLVILRNLSTKIRTKNNSRLLGLITYVYKNHRLDWDLLVGNNNLYPNFKISVNAKKIQELYRFKVIRSIRIEDFLEKSEIIDSVYNKIVVGIILGAY